MKITRSAAMLEPGSPPSVRAVSSAERRTRTEPPRDRLEPTLPELATAVLDSGAAVLPALQRAFHLGTPQRGGRSEGLPAPDEVQADLRAFERAAAAATDPNDADLAAARARVTADIDAYTAYARSLPPGAPELRITKAQLRALTISANRIDAHVVARAIDDPTLRGIFDEAHAPLQRKSELGSRLVATHVDPRDFELFVVHGNMSPAMVEVFNQVGRHGDYPWLGVLLDAVEARALYLRHSGEPEKAKPWEALRAGLPYKANLSRVAFGHRLAARAERLAARYRRAGARPPPKIQARIDRDRALAERYLRGVAVHYEAVIAKRKLPPGHAFRATAATARFGQMEVVSRRGLETAEDAIADLAAGRRRRLELPKELESADVNPDGAEAIYLQAVANDPSTPHHLGTADGRERTQQAKTFAQQRSTTAARMKASLLEKNSRFSPPPPESLDAIIVHDDTLVLGINDRRLTALAHLGSDQRTKEDKAEFLDLGSESALIIAKRENQRETVGALEAKLAKNRAAGAYAVQTKEDVPRGTPGEAVALEEALEKARRVAAHVAKEQPWFTSGAFASSRATTLMDRAATYIGVSPLPTAEALPYRAARATVDNALAANDALRLGAARDRVAAADGTYQLARFYRRGAWAGVQRRIHHGVEARQVIEPAQARALAGVAAIGNALDIDALQYVFVDVRGNAVEPEQAKLVFTADGVRDFQDARQYWQAESKKENEAFDALEREQGNLERLTAQADQSFGAAVKSTSLLDATWSVTGASDSAPAIIPILGQTAGIGFQIDGGRGTIRSEALRLIQRARDIAESAAPKEADSVSSERLTLWNLTLGELGQVASEGIASINSHTGPSSVLLYDLGKLLEHTKALFQAGVARKERAAIALDPAEQAYVEQSQTVWSEQLAGLRLDFAALADAVAFRANLDSVSFEAFAWQISAALGEQTNGEWAPIPNFLVRVMTDDQINPREAIKAADAEVIDGVRQRVHGLRGQLVDAAQLLRELSNSGERSDHELWGLLVDRRLDKDAEVNAWLDAVADFIVREKYAGNQATHATARLEAQKLRTLAMTPYFAAARKQAVKPDTERLVLGHRRTDDDQPSLYHSSYGELSEEYARLSNLHIEHFESTGFRLSMLLVEVGATYVGGNVLVRGLSATALGRSFGVGFGRAQAWVVSRFGAAGSFAFSAAEAGIGLGISHAAPRLSHAIGLDEDGAANALFQFGLGSLSLSAMRGAANFTHAEELKEVAMVFGTALGSDFAIQHGADPTFTGIIANVVLPSLRGAHATRRQLGSLEPMLKSLPREYHAQVKAALLYVGQRADQAHPRTRNEQVKLLGERLGWLHEELAGVDPVVADRVLHDYALDAALQIVEPPALDSHQGPEGLTLKLNAYFQGVQKVMEDAGVPAGRARSLVTPATTPEAAQSREITRTVETASGTETSATGPHHEPAGETPGRAEPGSRDALVDEYTQLTKTLDPHLQTLAERLFASGVRREWLEHELGFRLLAPEQVRFILENVDDALTPPVHVEALRDRLTGLVEKAAQLYPIDAPLTAADYVPPRPRLRQKMRPGYENETRGANPVQYLRGPGREPFVLTVRNGRIHQARSPYEGRNALFVMAPDGTIFAERLGQKGRFQHSSFLAGGEVAAAGKIVVEDGVVTLIDDQSGHYFPDPEHMAQLVFRLGEQGVDLSRVTVRTHKLGDLSAPAFLAKVAERQHAPAHADSDRTPPTAARPSPPKAATVISAQPHTPPGTNDVIRRAEVESREHGYQVFDQSPYPTADRAFYARVGLEPKSTIDLDGVRVHLSDPYALGGGRIAVVAYVELDGRVFVRSFYRSNSRGVWQVASHHGQMGRIAMAPGDVRMGLIDSWIGKGKGKGKHSTILPDRLQVALEMRARQGIKTLPDAPELRGRVAGQRAMDGTPAHSARQVTTAEAAFYGALQYLEATAYNRGAADHGLAFVHGSQDDPSSLALQDPAMSPDFSQAEGPVSVTLDPRLYPTPVHRYLVPAKNGRARFTFFTDGEVVWLGKVENVGSPITSFAVTKDAFDASALLVPPAEYRAMIPGGFEGEAIAGTSYSRVRKEWFDQVPLLREARVALLGK